MANRQPSKFKWTTEKYSKFVKETDSEYLVIGEYINNNTVVKMKHIKCNNEFDMRPANFKNGNRCPFCAGVRKRTLDSIKKDVFNLVGDEYEILSKEYINNKEKLLFHHNKCNHDFLMVPKDFLKENGNRCPKCKRSNGELEVERILNKYKINFESDNRNSGCVNKRSLQFDFKVILNNQIIYIEVDGAFHKKSWNDSKKEKDHLQDQINNDNIKNTFCKENNIKLIRIPYYNKNDLKNMENILIEELNLDKVN